MSERMRMTPLTKIEKSGETGVGVKETRKMTRLVGKPY